MRNVILITSNNKELMNIYQQWKDTAINIFYDNETLNLVIHGERIYIDYLPEGRIYYDEEELKTYYKEGVPSNFNIINTLFFSVRYSDREVMKYFIQKTSFSNNSFMDNDHDKILLVNDIKNGEILEFIE